jgi:hypothetical protein
VARALLESAMSYVCPLNSQPCSCDPKADPKARTYPCANARQLGKLVRLMTSDNEDEAQAASAAFMRAGQSKALLFDLAELIEKRGIGKLYSEDDLKTAIAHGQDLVRAEVGDGSAQYFDSDGEPIWLSIASFVQQHCDDPRLNRDFFREFASGIFDKVAHREPSDKMKKWLLVIFMKLGESCAVDIQTRYIRNI